MLGFLFKNSLMCYAVTRVQKPKFPFMFTLMGFTEIDDYQKSIKNSRSAHHILPSTEFYSSQQGDDDDNDDDLTSDNDDDDEEKEDSS